MRPDVTAPGAILYPSLLITAHVMNWYLEETPFLYTYLMPLRSKLTLPGDSLGSVPTGRPCA